MDRLKIVILSTCVLSLAWFLVTLNGCGGGSTPMKSPAQGKINHVVIIFQENRTPDNLFHDTVLMSRGADIALTGQTSTGQVVTLAPGPLITPYGLGHGHDSFMNQCQWNGSQCQMNGADLVGCKGPCPQNPPPAYYYVQQSDVQPYFTMAETYTFGDNMFQTNQGPSFPAHQYIISGTSAVSGASTTYVADNPSDDVRPDGTYWAGCLAPPDTIVNALDTSLSFPNKNYTYLTGTLAECFEHATLTDLLDQKGLSWKYYAAIAGQIWTAPNAIQHMCVPSSQDGNYDDTVCSGLDWTAPNPNVVIEGKGAQIITDITNGQLASVTWVIPDGSSSDHPGCTGDECDTGGKGPSWVASIVNAIGQSPFWADTAIIVTWDDWGGWFDHVAPPIRNTQAPLNSYEYGLRVPLIVISPYAKPQYVSHQQNDFGSILKFIEGTFGLPQIDPSVGYADSYALGDLSDCFNFNQTPLTFTPIQAPVGKQYFLHNTAKATPPDDD
jgi:phospholipase C